MQPAACSAAQRASIGCRPTADAALKVIGHKARLQCKAAAAPSRSSHSGAVQAARSRKSVVVQANWGAPVDFKPAKVLSNRAVAPGLHVIHVDVGAELAQGYNKPGQYIQAKVQPEGKAGFFAIASAPPGPTTTSGDLQLLIKAQPGTPAEALCGLQAGDSLLVSAAQGKGFPVERIPAAEFPTVLLFATGSGISPIKAVIESGALGARSELRLFYGTKSPESTAFAELVPEWEAKGVKVHQVYSGDDKTYVQDVLAAELPSLMNPKSVGVLLCGQKDMCNAVTETLKAHGVEQIMMNF